MQNIELENSKDFFQRLEQSLPQAHWVALNIVLTTGLPIYLVGGIVRDLILNRNNVDLDMVSLVPAQTVVRQMLPKLQAAFPKEDIRTLEHAAFGTVRVDVTKNLHFDIATARRELYIEPATLPKVIFTASQYEDLERRDFTINAMALSYQEEELVDPFGGRSDLQNGLLRVLHPASFRDDPTRTIRGVRFAARFGYAFEPETEVWLQQARNEGYVERLTAERKRNELRLILNETEPIAGLKLLHKYDLLTALHPLLVWNDEFVNNFAAIKHYFKGNPQPYQYLAALLQPFGPEIAATIIHDLRFAHLEANVPLEVAQLWESVRPSLTVGLRNSQLHALFSSYADEALQIFEALLPKKSYERGAVAHYRQKVAGRKPMLNGNDLIRLGVSPGPKIKTLLAQLQEAVMDGAVTGREAEENFLRQRINLNE